jgi:hypothetical protein
VSASGGADHDHVATGCQLGSPRAFFRHGRPDADAALPAASRSL